MKAFKDNFLNINNKNCLKSNKKDFQHNNNIIIPINNYINNNYYNPNNKSICGPSIDPFNITHNEVATNHADAIPESILNKLFNSIVRIVLYDGEATGFFMKFKLNNKEMRCLFTCYHVISDNHINNEITINIFWQKR